MKTIQIDLLGFVELEAPQQEKALRKLRDLNIDNDWWNFIYEDFKTIAGSLGVIVETDAIYFSGFYSQSDGAGYSAAIDLKKLVNGIATQSWKIEAPKLDLPLTLPTIDRRVLAIALNGRTDIEPRIIKKGRTYDVIANFGGYPANQKKNHDLIWAEIDELEKWLGTVAKVLNKFLYKTLTEEYEYLTSDEAVTNAIIGNNFVFTADGEIANRLEKLTALNS